jgi:hypothetical protein
LYNNKIKIVIDEAVNFEHEKVIQCEIKLGLVGRSIDLAKEGMPQQQ